MDNVAENQRVKRELEMRILSGKFGESGQIPTTKRIAEDYGVGTTTAGSVLRSLVKDGTLSSKQGVGYYVVPFARPALQKKYTDKLIDDIADIVKRAETINISKDDLCNMISEFYEKK